MIRTFIFLVLCGVIWVGEAIFDVSVQPETSTTATLAAVNGGNAEAETLRATQKVNGQFPLVASFVTLGAFALCYGGPIKRGIKSALEKSNA